MNPYEEQLLEKGYSLREIRRPGIRLTAEEALKRGFQSVEEYEEALHEFLNGQ